MKIARVVVLVAITFVTTSGCAGMPCETSQACLGRDLVCRNRRCVQMTEFERGVASFKAAAADAIHDLTK